MRSHPLQATLSAAASHSESRAALSGIPWPCSGDDVKCAHWLRAFGGNRISDHHPALAEICAVREMGRSSL